MSLYRKARPEEIPAPVNTAVNTGPLVNTGKTKDRHRPGYMAEYMRKRRAKK